jgi:hypothetical protein
MRLPITEASCFLSSVEPLSANSHSIECCEAGQKSYLPPVEVIMEQQQEDSSLGNGLAGFFDNLA